MYWDELRLLSPLCISTSPLPSWPFQAAVSSFRRLMERMHSFAHCELTPNCWGVQDSWRTNKVLVTSECLIGLLPAACTIALPVHGSPSPAELRDWWSVRNLSGAWTPRRVGVLACISALPAFWSRWAQPLTGCVMYEKLHNYSEPLGLMWLKMIMLFISCSCHENYKYKIPKSLA